MKRFRPGAPVLAVAAGAACWVGTATISARSGHGAFSDLAWSWSWLSFVVSGAVVVRRRPGHRAGWLMIWIGLGIEAADLLEALSILGHDVSWPGWLVATIALSAAALFVPPSFSAATGLLLLQPDDEVPSGWARWLLRAAVAAGGLVVLGVLLKVGDIAGDPIANPLGLSSAHWLAPLLSGLGAVLLVATMLPCIGLLAWRWRRADPEQRTALGYLALAAVTAGGLLLLALGLPALGVDPPSSVQALGVALMTCALPVGIGLSVVRSDYDSELALRRAITYAALTLAVVVGYAGLAIAAGGALQRERGLPLGIVITAVFALGLSPLRERAQAFVDRMLYGKRSDPYGVLRELDTRLAQTHEPSQVLPVVAATIGESLRLPWIRIEVSDLEPVSWGEPQPAERELELRHHGRRIGVLLLASRVRGERFSPLDDRLLQELAEHVGTAAAAVALAREAQRSRQRLVLALEDDRRRVRRDLHDGLGPTLGGVTLQLDALTRLTAELPEAQLLARTIRSEVADSLLEVRRLVHGLRPPVLDEVGLVEALRQHAQRLESALVVTLSASDLPQLPAAVEVAAYRIVTEALENVVRHADAAVACVRIGITDERLVLDVEDDGVGLTAGCEPGLGLASMRERAAELGGACQLSSGVHGLRVHVELPT